MYTSIISGFDTCRRVECEHVSLTRCLLLFVSSSRKNPLVNAEKQKKKENVKCTGGMKCYKIKALSEFHFQLLDSVWNSTTRNKNKSRSSWSKQNDFLSLFQFFSGIADKRKIKANPTKDFRSTSTKTPVLDWTQICFRFLLAASVWWSEEQEKQSCRIIN